MYRGIRLSYFLNKTNGQFSSKTTRAGTVPTSAKARLTSVTIRLRIRDPDRHQNLIICSLAHCQALLKMSCKSVRKLLRKAANKRTDTQTNDDENITSLAEVITFTKVDHIGNG